MFRELTRRKQALSPDACIELLSHETRGILAVNGEGGYPYAMPMNHYYDPEDGCIYFHCGRSGHRLDALRRSDQVSFCVTEQGIRKAGEWAYRVRSVIVFGRVRIIDDHDTVVRITVPLSKKFTQDLDYIKHELDQSARNTLILKLIPEHICGKIVTEA